MPKLKPNHISVTEEEDLAITAAAMSDPDALPFTDAEFESVKPFVRIGRPKSDVIKKRITIRLSPDVVEQFKQTGKGWQTRMDSALKDWLQHHPSV